MIQKIPQPKIEVPMLAPFTTESLEVKQTRLRQTIAAYQTGTEIVVEEADAMKPSYEPDDHIGYVYLVRHTRSWNNEIYEYVGETALRIQVRLDLHYNTAFSQKSQRLGLTIGGLHHAMMLEYQANPEAYRSCFTIVEIRTTVGPQARKDAEVEEVAKLKARTTKHYNLADCGGNRPPHLRYGQPITLAIGQEVFHFPSKTAAWAALDDASCPHLTKTLTNGVNVAVKARSRWLLVEEKGGTDAQMLGLEPLSPISRKTTTVKKGCGPAPTHIWQRFHPGSQQTPRGDLRNELEGRAKAAGIPEDLLATRILRARYSAGISTLQEAWDLLVEAPLKPTQMEIELPSMLPESRTLMGWGKFIEHSYSGPKVEAFSADEIQTNLRNALKHPETLTNDRKLHALGLKVLPRSRRTKREVFNTKAPTRRNLVAAEFKNPFTGLTEHFKSTAEMCAKYGVSSVVYYTRLNSGWKQAEALYVVKRKPSARVRKEYRADYEDWLAGLTTAELLALENEGYL